MLIVGSKGMAKEVLEIVSQEMKLRDEEICFFDPISSDLPSKLFGRFKIVTTHDEVRSHFKSIDTSFTLGLGGPKRRKKVLDEIEQLGGTFTTLLASNAHIGSFNTTLGEGCLLMHGSIVTNDVTIGKGVLININSTISHDCIIEDFVEITCGVTITGNCIIKEGAFIGSNAVLKPGVTIGQNAIVGAGAVVIQDVAPNDTVVGIPAKSIKKDAL